MLAPPGRRLGLLLLRGRLRRAPLSQHARDIRHSSGRSGFSATPPARLDCPSAARSTPPKSENLCALTGPDLPGIRSHISAHASRRTLRCGGIGAPTLRAHAAKAAPRTIRGLAGAREAEKMRTPLEELFWS
jgi:hypothetical protein